MPVITNKARHERCMGEVRRILREEGGVAGYELGDRLRHKYGVREIDEALVAVIKAGGVTEQEVTETCYSMDEEKAE